MPDTVMMEQFSLTQLAARGQFSPDLWPGARFSTTPQNLPARLVFDSLTQPPGREAEVIHHAGGGAVANIWRQIRADVLRCTASSCDPGCRLDY
jgi:hypothetical protein